MNGNSRISMARSTVATAGFSNALWDFIKKFSYYVARFIKRHGVPLFTAVVLVSLGFLLYAEIQRRMTKEIVVYTGPWGGAYREQGQLISSELERYSPGHFGSGYRLTPRATGGFEDNQRHLLQDDRGKSVGFVTDGFGGPEEQSKLRVLVPLEHNVLHIFCGLEFLRRVLPAGDPVAQLLTLDELAPHLIGERGRVYLGPLGSSTRQAAELVLQQHGLSQLSVSTHGVANYEEMRAALATGHIVLAFYCGPENAPVVKGIASDGTCRLVGLNGSHQGTIATAKGFLAHTIHKHTYRTGPFCSDDLATVKTQAVLACSKAMPDADAYAIIAAASTALSGQMRPDWRIGAYDHWNRQLDQPKTVLTLHSAAEIFLRGAQPSTMLTTMTYLLSTFGVWLLVELLKWVTARIPDRVSIDSNPHDVAPQSMIPATTTNGKPGKSAYEQLAQQIEQGVHELAEALDKGPEARTMCEHWLKHTNDVRKQITAKARQGLLSTKEQETLIALVNALRGKVRKFQVEIGTAAMGQR
jgi:TRAP-type uncharacterized transport system substrate-binding protein